VHGGVRDVITDRLGRGRIVGTATLDCVVDADRTVASISSEPAEPRLSTRIGRVAHRGWRAAAREVVGADIPLSSLLDDVPIAQLLSSYGSLRDGSLEVAQVRPMMLRMRNMCAGWAEDATPMRTMDAGFPIPLPGVVAVEPAAETDPLAAEPRSPQAPGEVRRVRRLDVVPGRDVVVHADFRDSWCDRAGSVGVLHEYVVTATLTQDGVVAAVEADPRVLPYTECTLAASSPQRLVGRRIQDVADEVRSGAGRATCSHLDDLLRTLVAVPALLRTAGDGRRPGW
jgi:hypothetical protein